MLLQILIPTYNRAEFLRKNLLILTTAIRRLNAQNAVGVVVSNNCSTDNTASILERFVSESKDLRTKIVTQSQNVGLERNAVATLSSASATYVMFLGDDDYITVDYLSSVISELRTNKYRCIVPSWRAVDTKGRYIAGSRDLEVARTVLDPSRWSAVSVLWRGHQLSGLVILRQGSLRSYLSSGLRNPYLFMYFAGYNAIHGRTLILPDYPVRVTRQPPGGKDWTYGHTGLVHERFKNVVGLFTRPTRWFAEWQLIRRNNRGFILSYAQSARMDVVQYVVFTLRCRYLTSLGKLLFVLLSTYDLAMVAVRGIRRERN